MKIDSSFVKDNFDFLKIIEHTSRDLVQANVSEFYLLRRHELFELQTVYELYNPEGLSWKGLLPSPTLKQRQQNWLWKKYPNGPQMFCCRFTFSVLCVNNLVVWTGRKG